MSKPQTIDIDSDNKLISPQAAVRNLILHREKNRNEKHERDKKERNTEKSVRCHVEADFQKRVLIAVMKQSHCVDFNSITP